ncbi:hypothetical protein ACBP82_12550 [Paenalcaligenes hominis]|uniref:hypothetical protein n=1 Tax=Paenalcaligenes hominis TaxID=643674 RepID=UPI003526C1FD
MKRKKNQFSLSRRTLLIGAASMGLVGCVATISPNAFIVTDELLGQRQLQSRRFDKVTEEFVVVSSSDVLQDMGFNLENSEVALGVLTASKDRDATNAGEIVGAVVLAVLFGANMAVSKSQRVRVSLVVQPSGKESLIAPSYVTASTTEPNMKMAVKEAFEGLPEEKQEGLIAADKIPGNYTVRVTFQREVTRTDNSVYVETINEPSIYEEFFDKLSKAMFIEAEQV